MITKTIIDKMNEEELKELLIRYIEKDSKATKLIYLQNFVIDSLNRTNRTMKQASDVNQSYDGAAVDTSHYEAEMIAKYGIVDNIDKNATYCSDCIHNKVCGNEGIDDVSMTFCADKRTEDKVKNENRPEFLRECFNKPIMETPKEDETNEKSSD